MTTLSLPILEILTIVDEESEDLNFLKNDIIKNHQVQDFFKIEGSKLKFRSRTECNKPNILNRLKRSLYEGRIFLKITLEEENHIGNLDYSPFVKKMLYENQNILQMNNKQFRYLQMNMSEMDVGHTFNKDINKHNWKEFYEQNMHFSPRNLWYQMIHKQSSNRKTLFFKNVPNIDDDKCTHCNLIEDAKHLLISCVHKLDIWDAAFKKFLGYPTTANPNQTYNSITLLDLKQYFIYNLDNNITIFDLFATIMRVIWKYHYLQIFQGVPFKVQIVFKGICNEVIRISNLKSMYT